MSVGWEVLPLLPLRCVMEHLSTEDALAAMSICQHWRSAMLLYEGRKDTLKLQAKHMEKNMFLARVFRKHTKRLHLNLDCNEQELEEFMTHVIPQFYDTLKLQEVVFIGPNYGQQNNNSPIVKLKRVITESLVFKQQHSIQKLGLLGCEMDAAKKNETYEHTHVERYSRSLSFSSDLSLADALLTRSNAERMAFSTLQHVMADYAQLSTEALQTMSQLAQLAYLSINVCNKQQLATQRVDWRRLQPYFPNGLEVAVNIIALPRRKFNKVIQNVLCEGLVLTSLKVLFCKTFFTPLLTHVAHSHKDTLRELVWADCPSEAADRVLRPNQRQPGYDTCNVNPFILLCWQCTQLRRLAVHGYWIWQYDLLGCVRLRKTLEQLEVSAFYNKQDRLNGAFQPCSDSVVRVLACDNMKPTNPEYVQQVNDYTEFEWKPIPWHKLHPGLRSGGIPPQRTDYIVQEIRQPYGLTLYSA